MISAKSQTPPPNTTVQELVFESVFRSDYLFWLITEYVRPLLLTMFGVSGDVQEQIPARPRQLSSDFVDSLNSISLREDGIYHDRDTLAVLPQHEFKPGQISVPTLVVHAVDDGLQPYSHAENTATKVPDAEFLSYEQGGHLLLLQLDEVHEEVATFHERHFGDAYKRARYKSTLASMTTTAHKILYWLTASLCVPQGRTFRPTPRLLPENPRETVRGVPLARSRRKFGQDREGETSPNVPFDRRMGLGLVGQGCSPVRNFSDSL